MIDKIHPQFKVIGVLQTHKGIKFGLIHPHDDLLFHIGRYTLFKQLGNSIISCSGTYRSFKDLILIIDGFAGRPKWQIFVGSKIFLFFFAQTKKIETESKPR